MKTGRCCILYNKPREGATADELDILEQVEWVEQHLAKMNIPTYRYGITTNFMEEMAHLAINRPDYVFNLVESINNKGELLYFIPALLNMYSIPYTGNPLEAMFITTSKKLTVSILQDAGISNPGYYSPALPSSLTPGNKYIIKPIWEDGSMGITADSVFTYDKSKDSWLSGFKESHWMIQDFIDGREFNISVMNGKNGPEVLPAAEMTFVGYEEHRPRIVDFKAKWEEGSFEYENTVRKFPGENLESILVTRLEKVALDSWKVFGLKGYARVDMRVDSNNIPRVIEVNANPCISHNGGFVAATEAAGYDFTDVLSWIIDDMNF
ncbi:MAG: ATP-grasp domain-containing protein [Bacteroidales bacterium]